ncbi:MAG: hypothetical protein ACI841_002701 [Planctomycetota bacterium]|jgi:hypothetical protein
MDDVASSPTAAGVVLADFASVSDDDGQSWTTSGLGIGLNDQIFEVSIDPNDP